MIRIHIVYDENHEILGFRASGHAGYDEFGRDIVCAGVSTLTVNLVNSILNFTDDDIVYETAADGLLRMKFCKDISDDAKLLFSSCVAGLRDIEETYGNKYIRIMEVQKLSNHNYKIITNQEV